MATTYAFLGMPGGMEWIVVLVVALLLFGRRLPEVARSMGKGIVEFKRGLKDVEDDVKKESRDDLPPPPPPPPPPPSDDKKDEN